MVISQGQIDGQRAKIRYNFLNSRADLPFNKNRYFFLIFHKNVFCLVISTRNSNQKNCVCSGGQKAVISALSEKARQNREKVIQENYNGDLYVMLKKGLLAKYSSVMEELELTWDVRYAN